MRNLLGKFYADKSGMFAIMVLILLMALTIGMLIVSDLQKARVIREDLSKSFDVAVLAATKSAADGTPAEVAAIIDTYMKANINPGIVTVNPATITMLPDNRVSASMTASMATDYMHLIGIPAINFNLDIEAESVVEGLELALVLDTTNSMHPMDNRGNFVGTHPSRLEVLQVAANNLVEAVMPNSGSSPDNASVAVIPFGSHVNVGTAAQTWLHIPMELNIPHWETDACPLVNLVPATCYADAIPYNCLKCNITPTVGGWEYFEYRWYGCVASRLPLDPTDSTIENNDPNIMDTDAGTDPIRGMVWLKPLCPSPVQPLTKDKNVVAGVINTILTNGETYIPSGLMWGWRALSPIEPLTEGVAYSDTSVQKVIVLMSDGDNTRKADWPLPPHDFHYGTNDPAKLATVPTTPPYFDPPTAQPEDDPHNQPNHITGDPDNSSYMFDSVANETTARLCDNIKAVGIRVFTVGFEVTDANTLDMLKYCATDGSHYYDAGNHSEFQRAFEDITHKLLSLRLTK
jgi:hypothetical protein